MAAPTAWLLTSIYSPQAIPSEKDWENHVRTGGDPAGFIQDRLADALAAYTGDASLPVQLFLERLLVHALSNSSPSDAEVATGAADWLCGQETSVEDELFLDLLPHNRLLYSYQDAKVQVIADPVTLAGRTYPVGEAGGPLGVQEQGNIAGLIRPYLPGLSTYLSDARERNTGVAARLPFDVVVYVWQQQMARESITACTLSANTTAPVPPWVVGPSSGISTGIEVTGTGFAPDSQVVVSGHSSPVTLGAAWADSSGSIVIFLNQNDQLGLGKHEIIAVGRDPSGQARRLTWNIRIDRMRTVAAPFPPHRTSTWANRWLWAAFGVSGALLIVAGFVLRGRRRHRRVQPVD